MKEYYDYYLSLHTNKNCRLFHFVGQNFTIFYLIYCIYFSLWYFLVFAPFIVYPFAWSGHYFFEKNKPAAYKNPLKAKLADWMMYKDIILGRIKIW